MATKIWDPTDHAEFEQPSFITPRSSEDVGSINSNEFFYVPNVRTQNPGNAPNLTGNLPKLSTYFPCVVDLGAGKKAFGFGDIQPEAATTSFDKWFADPTDIPEQRPNNYVNNYKFFVFNDVPTFTTDLDYFGIYDLAGSVGPFFWDLATGYTPARGFIGWGTYNEQTSLAKVSFSTGNITGDGGGDDFVDYGNAEWQPFDVWMFRAKYTVAGDVFEWKLWSSSVSEPVDWQIDQTGTLFGLEPGFLAPRNADGSAAVLYFASVGTDGEDAPRMPLAHTQMAAPTVTAVVDSLGNMVIAVSDSGQISTRYEAVLAGATIYDSGYVELSDRYAKTIPTLPVGTYTLRVTVKDQWGIDSAIASSAVIVGTRDAPTPPDDPITSLGVISIVTDIASDPYLGPTFTTARSGSGQVEAFAGYSTLDKRSGFVMRTIGSVKQEEWEFSSSAIFLHNDRYPIAQAAYLGPGPSFKKRIRLSDTVRYKPRGITDPAAWPHIRNDVFFWGSHSDGFPDSNGKVLGGIGFRIFPGSGNGFFWNAYLADSAGTPIINIPTGIDSFTSRLLEVEYDGDTRDIRWYIDSVLVAENTSLGLTPAGYEGFGPTITMRSAIAATASFFTYPFQMVRTVDIG